MRNLKKPIVAIFTDIYLPGVKGGGPIRTIEAIVETLGDRYDFHIFTGDRDLGDAGPYEFIARDVWLDRGSYKVIYLSPEKWSLQNLRRLLDLLSPQIIYLNSFFSSTYSQKLYLLKLLGRIKGQILMAPRGEFSAGALQLKSLKKNIYLKLYKIFYRPSLVSWHASTTYELNDIMRVLPSSRNIFVASDVSLLKITNMISASQNLSEKCVKIVFISRISPKKNLKFAIRSLKNSKFSAIMDVYGPVEDESYWESCLKEGENLPKNVQFKYEGALSHDKIRHKFAEYDIFLFPTLGENFGHVIVESLSSGCLVMTSKNVPWNDLEQDGAGWNLILNEEDFLRELTQYSLLSVSARDAKRKSAIGYAQAKFDPSVAAEETAVIFNTLIDKG
ncbi:glycosyltransferase [Deinococcus marmoris]|uniref:glycosyltransferase n=1 Tax=Deinococcus marmoris TaxID=249408 RepID=UPI0011151FD1|nr:glycosyltransferase [Deinococcus marmoris]